MPRTGSGSDRGAGFLRVWADAEAELFGHSGDAPHDNPTTTGRGKPQVEAIEPVETEANADWMIDGDVEPMADYDSWNNGTTYAAEPWDSPLQVQPAFGDSLGISQESNVPADSVRARSEQAARSPRHTTDNA